MSNEAGSGQASVTHEDVTHILGDMDDETAVEIIALKPTLSELEQAAAYLAGSGETLAKSGHPLSGVVADIVNILAVEEEEPPPPR